MPAPLPHFTFVLLDKVAFMKAAYLYWAIILFSVLALVLIVSMLVIVLHKKSTVIKRILIGSQLEEWMMDVILENTVDASHVFLIPNNIKFLLQGSLAKKVLLHMLIELKKSLSGMSGDNLNKIYNQLNLQEISLRRVASRLWHVKAKGIQELAIMNQHAHYEKIFELTHHKDHMVRMEAQTGMVRLQGYKGLQFFDDLSYPLSEWHQLNLLHLLANMPITTENGIFNWLHSSNASVVQFSLKLIAGQHAIQFHDDAVKCLSNPDKVIRREAILCLGQIPSDEAAMELSTRFSAEPDKNIRLTIISEFRKTGSDLDFPFLKTLQHAEDVDIKLAADKTVLYLQNIFKS